MKNKFMNSIIDSSGILFDDASYILTAKYDAMRKVENFICRTLEEARAFESISTIFSIKAWGTRGYK